MSRPLAPHEYKLLDFLLEVNEPLYGKWTRQWRDQIKTCQVREIDTPYFLAVCHDDEIEKSGQKTLTLGRELISVDGRIPVLIYAIVVKTQDNYYVDIFSIDRLDGEKLINYPIPGNGLMVMEAGMRVGGADLRYAYKENPLAPRWRLV
ncbi:hypothetical protein [Paraburkholderia hayleyella]|uniref:hypothetical protein n=1 Tax=Paraburkholderia hayleyella TaxID=2152889 RepID=UPI001290D24D|nr:hypothetical protein [Paraburkholderia hayleyella]